MCVWCPMLAIDLLRRGERRLGRSPDGRPVLIAEDVGPRRVVTHACERAQAAGVRAGMGVADARALIPGGARVVAGVPERVRARLGAIALWATRFAPSVAPDPPDGLLLDVTGCAPVWGGEERLAAAAVGALAALGLRARASVAPTFGAAWALARFADPPRPVTRDGELRAALAPLPVGALRLDARTLGELATLGIDRVGQLAALPRRTLPARFGEALLLQLDRATGAAIETIDPVRAPDPARGERVFDGPTARWDAIERTVRDLLEDVADRLRAREEGALRVEVTLRRSDLAPAVVVASLSRPSRDARHLWSLLRPRLERTHLGFGVEAVAVVAVRSARVTHEQQQRWGGGEGAGLAEREARLIDTLGARLGEGRVRRAGLRESHIPERAAAWWPAGGPAPGEGAPPAGDRPTLLLDPPEESSVMALTPDGPVLRLSWRGREHAVVRCVGPERLGPEWWAGDREGRDYFKLQDEEGRWVWAFRGVSSRRWCVHGVWA